MASTLQFHPLHGEHIKLSKNNTVAKRIDSFCKGICFSNRTINVRERIHVRLLMKSVQWTGFLRLGVTTCDPSSHRTSTALPRHACPDLTCRPGYWAKCVPENCFDSTSKSTYFYVDQYGELYLNTPNGEISLLTGINTREPMWALLDIYGNCISIELIDEVQPRTVSLNDQVREMGTGTVLTHFRDLRRHLEPVTFFSVHTPTISFFVPSPNVAADTSLVLFDHTQKDIGVVFLSELLKINSGFLVKIVRLLSAADTRRGLTSSATVRATQSPAQLQLGLINCDLRSLAENNDVPLTLDQLNSRTEFSIIQDFEVNNKTSIDQGDEFLFALNADGVIVFSHNNSKFKEFVHLDSSLSYYPFLIFQGNIIAVRLMGYIRNFDPALSTPITPPIETKVDKACIICLDQDRETVLIPCGHVCLCFQCADDLHRNRGSPCPICRANIMHVQKIYVA